MSEGFVLDTSTAMLYFRIIRRYNVESHSARVSLLRELTRRKKAKYLRDVESFVEGKNVIEVKRKRGENEN